MLTTFLALFAFQIHPAAFTIEVAATKGASYVLEADDQRIQAGTAYRTPIIVPTKIKVKMTWVNCKGCTSSDSVMITLRPKRHVVIELGISSVSPAEICKK